MLTLIAVKFVLQFPSDELQNTLIYCNNYGQAGALNYYNRNKMTQVYSLTTDYIYWLPTKMKLQNMLLVGEIPNDELINMFKEYKQVGVVENEYARGKGTKIFLFLGADSSASEMLYKLAEERKKNFDIF